LGSWPWPFKVTWRHRWRHHLIRHIIIIIFIFRKQDNNIYYQINTFGRLPEKHTTHWLAACVTNECLKNNHRGKCPEAQRTKLQCKCKIVQHHHSTHNITQYHFLLVGNLYQASISNHFRDICIWIFVPGYLHANRHCAWAMSRDRDLCAKSNPVFWFFAPHFLFTMVVFFFGGGVLKKIYGCLLVRPLMVKWNRAKILVVFGGWGQFWFLLQKAHPCSNPCRLSDFAWRSVEGSDLQANDVSPLTQGLHSRTACD